MEGNLCMPKDVRYCLKKYDSSEEMMLPEQHDIQATTWIQMQRLDDVG